MPIENRNLRPGTRLVATYKKKTYLAEVVKGEEGKVKYRLQDGQEFKSPSAAGVAITSKACNGWMFWNVEEGVESYPWAEVPDDEQQAKDSPDLQDPEQAKKFKKVPNQKAVPPGQVRYYCNECQESFTAPAEGTPEACPQGHRPDGSKLASGASES